MKSFAGVDRLRTAGGKNVASRRRKKVEPFQTMTAVVASQREDEIPEMCGMVVRHAAGEALPRRGLEGRVLCIRGTRAGQV